MIRWVRELEPADCSSILLGLLLVPVLSIPAAVAVLLDDQPCYYKSETRAVGALKTISVAQSTFREEDKDRNGALDYADSLRALRDASLISDTLGAGVRGGYRFYVQRGTESEFVWAATADPVTPGKTGARYFATNHLGVTFYTTSGPIAVDPVTCSIPPGPTPWGP